MRLATLTLVGLVALAVGCGASHATGPRDAATDTGAFCTLAPTGSFTFQIHNAGTSDVVLNLGCGANLPIVLSTPDGRLSAGPGAVDFCEFTCDRVYAGQAIPGGCTDCGGGVSRTIAPGASVAIAWDRRVYAQQTVDPACTAARGTCALGFAVAPSSTQTGVITSCPADKEQTFSCAAPVMKEFSVDTTGAEATIDVGS